MSRHQPGSLISCSGEDCHDLVTREDAVDGDFLETYFDSRGNQVKRLGLYCPRCAMSHGYFPPKELKRIETLLIDAGLIPAPKKRRSGVSEDRHEHQTLELPL